MLSAFPGDPVFYLAAIPAVILLGLSKGGFSGLSSLAMPLFALAISPVKAAAIMLPILIVQDWVSVWAFRRDWDLRNLAILAPAGAIGVAAGWLMAARVDEQAVRLAVGLISVGFVVFMLLRDRLASGAATRATVAPGLFWGAIAGFTSFISHAGAPPTMVYMLPQKLTPRIFAGTSAILFAIINLLKVVALFRSRPVQPRQPLGVGVAAAGGGRGDLRRRLAGGARVGRSVLRRGAGADLHRRRQADLGRRLGPVGVARI